MHLPMDSQPQTKTPRTFLLMKRTNTRLTKTKVKILLEVRVACVPTASGAKRIIIYKRDWCGLLCQIVIPITLVLFGLWLQAGPTNLTQSPPRPLSTGFYPYKQRVLMNSNPVNMTGDGFDVTGAELAAALPNATTAFDVKLIDETLNYT